MSGIDIEAVVSEVVSEIKKRSARVTLAAAKRVAARVEEKAAEIGVRAVVAIVNEGARPVLVECTDDSFIASYDIALNKAYTSASLKMSTSELKKLSQPGCELYGIQYTNESKIVIFGGGEPIKAGGRVIGGIGVSGGTEAQDTFLGEYAAKIAEEEFSCQSILK